MIPGHRLSAVLATIGFVSVLTGCLSSRPQQFSMSFLPAPAAVAPAPAPAITAAVRPAVPLNVPASVLLPVATKPHRPAPASETDLRIRSADEHYDTARRAYAKGEYETAREEFNRAIDALLNGSETGTGRQKIEDKLDQLVDAIYRYDMDGLAPGEKRGEVVYDKSPLEGMLELTFPVDPKLKPIVKEEIQATVSQLPLDQNDAVLSYIHFFSTERGRKTLVSGLRRSGRYRPLIRRILNEEGVPEELIYLAQAESGFLPRAVSNKQATGMWQFISDRGRQYGLMRTAVSDDRLDPEKATRAAARHLRDLYAHFGDWYLAMAAYNCGPGCVDRAVQRTGYADFWQLSGRNVLPKQTMNYVPLILAITIMAKNPKDYGLDDLDLDQPVEYETIDLKAATAIALVADAAGRPASEIRELNPALLRNIAPSGYQLRLPKGTANTVMAALENVPAQHRTTWRMHHVERGESLDQIARRYGTAASSIAAVNNTAEAPEEGDVLIVPASYDPDAPAPRARASVRRNSHHTAGAHTVTAKNAHHGRAVLASNRVPDHVLHHRAGVRTYKTASVSRHRH